MLVHVVLRWLLAADAGMPCQAVFEPPEGAVKLCDQHVRAVGSEIEWTSWAVSGDRPATFEPYRQRALACKIDEVTPFTLADGPRRLSVHLPTDPAMPTCSKQPSSSARSVVVISVKHDLQERAPRAH